MDRGGEIEGGSEEEEVKRGHQQHIQEENLLEFLENYHQELNVAKLEPDIRSVINDARGKNSAGDSSSQADL